MDAGSKGALPPTSVPLQDLLKDAGLWALVTLGLCFPIILLRTEQDLTNRIVLDPQPWLVAGIVFAVFAGRLLWRLAKHPQRKRILPFAAARLLARSSLAAQGGARGADRLSGGGPARRRTLGRDQVGR